MIYNVSNIPVGYNDINQYNSSMSPNTIHTKNTACERYFVRYLLQKAMSVFKWVVPDNWDLDYLLYNIYCTGYVAVINTAKFGVIPQQCCVAGYNVYYRPNRVLINNPLLKKTELMIGVNTEIIKLTPDYCGIFDLISRYASEMALAMETMDVNIVNSKLSYVFSARNKASAESLKMMIDKINAGETSVFYDEKIRRNTTQGSEPPWEVFSQDLSQNFIAPDVIDVLRRLEELFCNEVGIPNTRSDKRERMISAEAQSNNIESFSRAEMWLEELQRCCDRVNDMFGINVSVDWRHKPSDVSQVDGGVGTQLNQPGGVTIE